MEFFSWLLRVVGQKPPLIIPLLPPDISIIILFLPFLMQYVHLKQMSLMKFNCSELLCKSLGVCWVSFAVENT